MMQSNRRHFVKSAIIGSTALMANPFLAAAQNAELSFFGEEGGADISFGDRNLKSNFVFPPDVFMHNGKGGRLIDITKAPYFAKGDGVTDDTAAFVKAYDFVLAELDKFDWLVTHGSQGIVELIIYIPNGKYLVSDTIIYSGPWRNYKEKEEQNAQSPGKKLFEKLVKIRFYGQDREKTIIKLRDNCAGFSDQPKPVVSFGKADLNNSVAYNSFRNITINTGRGNPSAIGLDFAGANNTGIHNVSVISEDGKGIAGIDIRINPSMGYHNDITVTGFDYGIRMTPHHMTHNVFEYVTTKNQNKAGIQLVECSTSLRKWHSVNSVSAFEMMTDAAQAIILDSKLESSGSSLPAIDVKDGYLFARNVETVGYKNAASLKGSTVELKNSITEYVSAPVLSLNENQRKQSLNLPIEEVPIYFWESNLSKWANVDDFGAVGDGTTDDTEAIQRAFNSGKPVIYFPKTKYLATALSIPGSVKHIMGFYVALLKANIHIKGSTAPLLIEDFGDNSTITVHHDQPRTLILSHVRSLYFSKHKNPDTKVFLNNCNNMGKNPEAFTSGKFWARFINTEYKAAPSFSANGVDMWVLGYKVEGKMTNFEVLNGGKLEILGGIINEHGPGFQPTIPALKNTDSSLCYIGLTNGPQKFEIIVEETRNGITKKLMAADCSRRGKGTHMWDDDTVVAMYVSYK